MTESNRIEYKLTLTDDLEREVVAFLNYNEGGIIFIGCQDNGDIVGLENANEDQCKIVERIKNNILPNTLGLFEVVLEKCNGKSIIKIIISSGTEKPYYLKKKGMSTNGCFLRVGNTAQPMTTHQIEHLFSSRVRNSISRITSPRQELSFEQLRIYYQEKRLELNEHFAKTLDLLTEDGRYNYVAYLLADSNAVSIKVAKYAGKDKVDLIENEEYGFCSIIKATNRVLEKLTVENRTFTKITPIKRLERQMVNAVALREAVVNAIVHNDYSYEVPPVFEIYSDRITVTSYGGLVPNLSRENFFKCHSVVRNRELMRIFRDLDLVEQLGSGMSRILKVYDERAFDFSGNFLIVTFPFEEEFESTIVGDSVNKHENTGGNPDSKGGCFIATCVYDSYDCPEVRVLRLYRDNTLANNIWGRLFINIYYSISPIIIKLFGKSVWFTKFCRGRLDKLVHKLKKNMH
ncbi:MAG: putative DNA binding domain-containing protein [Synergistaceae bacterium]|nr:putative DNA binding domain-containing protein [Synergistaceae bacterium]